MGTYARLFSQVKEHKNTLAVGSSCSDANSGESAVRGSLRERQRCICVVKNAKETRSDLSRRGAAMETGERRGVNEI